jgi:hypothetical protein
MSLTGSSKNDIKLEAVSVKWGREECRKVTFVDDVAGSLDAEYWDLNTLDEDQVETQYVVWLDNGASVDPSGTKTGIQVTYADDDSASVIAGLFVTALAAINVNVSQSGAEVIYENKDIGAVTEEDKTNATALTFEVLSAGIGGSLGATSSGSTLSIETQSVELRSDQSGQIILGEIYTGSTASVEMSLIEMTKARWETVIGSVTGDKFTPTAGTRLVGQGVSRLYKNLFDLGGKLILSPIRLAGTGDKTEDIIFWKSAPKPSSVSFSGQDIQGMEVAFTAYNDTSKPAEISLWSQGDYTQDLV